MYLFSYRHCLVVFISVILSLIDIYINLYCVLALALSQVFNRTRNTVHFLVGVQGTTIISFLLAPAVTVGETEGAMDSTSGFFWPLLLPITL